MTKRGNLFNDDLENKSIREKVKNGKELINTFPFGGM